MLLDSSFIASFSYLDDELGRAQRRRSSFFSLATTILLSFEMLASLLLPFVSLSSLVFAQGNPTWDDSNSLVRTPFTPITINASDGSIAATFIPYGATVANLFVKDRNGIVRDVVLGYDELNKFATDPTHPNFGPIVGRYANRIKNNTFTDPTTGQVFHTPPNENNGTDTLHGGPYGFSWRVWTVTDASPSSVTLQLFDPDGLEGFPGQVHSQVKYSLYPGGIWDIDLYAQASSRTPILLSSHVYWNLDGYSIPNATVKEYVLSLPYATKVVETDTILIPTGPWINVTDTAYNFLQPRTIGNDWNGTLGYPGLGGYGYDTCWINEKWTPPTATKLEVYSPGSGIKLAVTSNQRAIQIYTCGGQHGTIPVKSTQGTGFVEQNSCMVIEMEDVIGAINYPEWGLDQWYSPSRPYDFHASYQFSTI
ncbi:galactose mutarotase-like domain-containing protein [Mrakia frigida]|uniref:galactose mutarotase-like domain-containing protein n=1 Tax=Mrakia frigida TaxID=29902 RepID=UPI003FCC1959